MGTFWNDVYDFIKKAIFPVWKKATFFNIFDIFQNYYFLKFLGQEGTHETS